MQRRTVLAKSDRRCPRNLRIQPQLSYTSLLNDFRKPIGRETGIRCCNSSTTSILPKLLLRKRHLDLSLQASGGKRVTSIFVVEYGMDSDSRCEAPVVANVAE